MKIRLRGNIYTARRDIYSGENIIKDENGQYCFPFMFSEIVARKRDETDALIRYKEHNKPSNLKKLIEFPLSNDSECRGGIIGNNYRLIDENGEKVVKTRDGQYCFPFMREDVKIMSGKEALVLTGIGLGIALFGCYRKGELQNLINSIKDFF